jgi:hypothetical protein
MATASEIIKRCGGNKAVADWLGMERSGVQRWAYAPPKGCGNRVPSRHWAALIKAAAANGVHITLDELMPTDMANVARRQAKTSRAA